MNQLKSEETGIVGQISAAPRAPVSNYVKLLCQIALNVKFFAGPAVSNFFADVRDASNFFRAPSNFRRPAGPSCQILSDASNFSRTPSNSRRAAGPSCQILSDASNSHSDAVKFSAPGGPLCQILCSSVNGFLRTASNSRRPAGPSCPSSTQQRPSFVRTASESRMHPAGPSKSVPTVGLCPYVKLYGSSRFTEREREQPMELQLGIIDTKLPS